ncbi:MAG: transposase [Chloroflexi bacterium]|nr:transposase [Chloroflexota bacterium]
MSYDQMLNLGNGNQTLHLPDPEVTPKAKRRAFSAEYKLRILDEAHACRTPAERGALLRREGLYGSHLTHWRRELHAGAMAGLKPKKRGPKTNPLVLENANLRRELAQLQTQLERAETIIEVHRIRRIRKNISHLMSLPLPSATTESNGSRP